MVDGPPTMAMTPTVIQADNVFPEDVSRYIEPKTLKWRFCTPSLDYRVKFYIVGKNLVMAAVNDFTRGELVCFPERHVNWARIGHGYLSWLVKMPLGTGLPCDSKIWHRHAQRVATLLKTELENKGIEGPDYPNTTSQVEFSLDSHKSGFPDENIPLHAFSKRPSVAPRPKVKPLKTTISDDGKLDDL